MAKIKAALDFKAAFSSFSLFFIFFFFFKAVKKFKNFPYDKRGFYTTDFHTHLTILHIYETRASYVILIIYAPFPCHSPVFAVTNFYGSFGNLYNSFSAFITAALSVALKTVLPATITFAPADLTDFTFSSVIPPSISRSIFLPVL